MKLLPDANISRRLEANLKNHFNGYFHIDNIGLSIPAADREILDYALTKLTIPT
ncbi:MAG: DUF5615 family PIN-like protein [Chitinophagaceae bacterium]|nr:DUF5615 family PIN-like protein [Chitinophagaceae bacterium]